MKQVLQSIRSGQVHVAEVPAPIVPDKGVLVRTIASLVSAGTERMVVEFAEKNLLQKARARPDLVRQVLQRVRRDGLLADPDTVQRNLDSRCRSAIRWSARCWPRDRRRDGMAVGDLVACAGACLPTMPSSPPCRSSCSRACRRLRRSRVPVAHAAFATLGAIAMHGFRLASPQLGERVAVIGLGLLGQLAVQIARAAGCRVFGVDSRAARVALARRAGRGRRVHARRSRRAQAGVYTGGAGFDVVLLTADATTTIRSSSPAAIARDRAHVIAVGAFDLPLPRKPYFQQGTELPGLAIVRTGPLRSRVRAARPRTIRSATSAGPSSATSRRSSICWTAGAVRRRAADLPPLRRRRRRAGLRRHHRQGGRAVPRRAADLSARWPSRATRIDLAAPPVAPGDRRRRDRRQPRRAPASSPRHAAAGARQAGDPSRCAASSAPRACRRAWPATPTASPSARRGSTMCWRTPIPHAVFILTRHHLHAAQSVAALRAGKHVFVEKPLCLTREELRGDRRRRIAARAGRC